MSVGTTQPAGFEGASADGRRVVFSSGENLTPDDRDGLCDRGEDDYWNPLPKTPCVDLYVRDLTRGTTQLVSTGPLGGAGAFDASFVAISKNGRVVVFKTAEQLTGDDGDLEQADLYARDLDAGTTQLVAAGPGVQDFKAVNDDGSLVFYATTGSQIPVADTNGLPDVYVRDLLNGTTEVVSAGNDGRAAGGGFGGIAANGRKAFFVSSAPIDPADTDACTNGTQVFGCSDVYERDLATGTTTLISTGPNAVNGGPPRRPQQSSPFAGSTADGTRVFFESDEALVDDDVEAGCPDTNSFPTHCIDVYERSGGVTTLISTGPSKNGNDSSGIPKYTSDPAHLWDISDDGSRVFFRTAESLVPADTNSAPSIYERHDGTTTLLSGSRLLPTSSQGDIFAGMARDGSRVFVLTAERWTPDDIDNGWDVYVRYADGRLERVTPSGTPNWHDRDLIGTSDDGSRFFYRYGFRIFEWHDGTTTLVARGYVFTGDPRLGAIGDQGRRLFFSTEDQLAPNDTDAANDAYVSIANSPPECTAVAADRQLLWPANRRFRTVRLSGATDPDGDPVTIEITGVTQDERVRGAADARPGSADDEVLLRAERDARGDGRVYRIAFEVSDDHGGSCTGTATVAVPRHKREAAVDSAPPSYDSE